MHRCESETGLMINEFMQVLDADPVSSHEAFIVNTSRGSEPW